LPRRTASICRSDPARAITPAWKRFLTEQRQNGEVRMQK
jgi:hypothetical protein